MNPLSLNESAPRADRLQIAAVIGIVLLGLAFIYSATKSAEAVALVPLVKQLWFRQVFWCVCGTAAAVAICLVDYHTLTRWAFVFYWVMIALLALVLVFGTV